MVQVGVGVVVVVVVQRVCFVPGFCGYLSGRNVGSGYAVWQRNWQWSGSGVAVWQ